MTPEEKLRAQAVLNQIVMQRNEALSHCAHLAGEIAVLRARVQELENPVETVTN